MPQETAPKTLRVHLLEELQSGVYADCDRLPPENILSEQLGISRTQLRDMLSALEREGFITRRHGVGTMVNRHVLNVQNRMDIAVEFLDIIRQNGYEPGVAYVHMREEEASKSIADRLQIPEGTEVARICRLCTADGKPAIYCEDVLEKRLLKGEFTVKDLEHPIYVFLPQVCGISAYMDLTEIHAVSAEGVVAEALGVPQGTPVLNLEEVDFDIDGKPIFCSSEYFVDALLRHTVLRKKL